MGTSEVGHQNMAAGRVAYQDIDRIAPPGQSPPSRSSPFGERAFSRADQVHEEPGRIGAGLGIRDGDAGVLQIYLQGSRELLGHLGSSHTGYEYLPNKWKADLTVGADRDRPGEISLSEHGAIKNILWPEDVLGAGSRRSDRGGLSEDRQGPEQQYDHKGGDSGPGNLPPHLGLHGFIPPIPPPAAAPERRDGFVRSPPGRAWTLTCLMHRSADAGCRRVPDVRCAPGQSRGR